MGGAHKKGNLVLYVKQNPLKEAGAEAKAEAKAEANAKAEVPAEQERNAGQRGVALKNVNKISDLKGVEHLYALGADGLPGRRPYY